MISFKGGILAQESCEIRKAAKTGSGGTHTGEGGFVRSKDHSGPDGECPGEPGCGRQIDEREPCGGLGRVRADLMAYFFDEGEEVIALAAGEGLAEERAELANLAAKARIEAL